MGNKQSKPSTVTATYIRYVTLTEHHTRTEFSTATTTDTTTITTTSTTTTYRDVPERYQTDVNLFISFLDSLPTLLFVSIGLVLIGYTVYGIFKVADKVWQSYLARDKRGVRGNIVFTDSERQSTSPPPRYYSRDTNRRGGGYGTCPSI